MCVYVHVCVPRHDTGAYRMLHMIHMELSLPTEHNFIELTLLEGIELRRLRHQSVEGGNGILLRAKPEVGWLLLLREFDELLGDVHVVRLLKLVRGLVEVTRELIAPVQLPHVFAHVSAVVNACNRF